MDSATNRESIAVLRKSEPKAKNTWREPWRYSGTILATRAAMVSAPSSAAQLEQLVWHSVLQQPLPLGGPPVQLAGS